MQLKQPILGHLSNSAAISVVLLGLVVMAGWHLHLPQLFQLRDDLTPMQYNTALSFVCVGAALLLLGLGQTRWTQIGATMVALIGGLTLIEYLGSVDLGIDQLLMTHYVTTQTTTPGRMAPNTALSFVLSSLALLLAVRRLPLASGLVAIFVLILATIPLSGYIFGVESAYGWAKLTRMAPHTAVGFIVFTFGVFMTVREHAVAQFVQLSINGRLAIGFSAMLIIALAIGLTALAKIDTISRLSEQLDRNAMQVSNAALAMKINTIQINRSMKNLVLYTGAREKKTALDDIAGMERGFYRNLSIVTDNYLGPMEEINVLRTDFQQWRAFGSESVRLLNAGRRDLFATRTLYDGDRMAAKTESVVDAISAAVFNEAKRLNKQVRIARGEALYLLLIMLGLAVLLAMAISITITRSIRKQLYGLSSAMTAITEGKADSDIPYQEDRHEIGHMARAVKVFKGYLTEINRLQDRFKLIVENSPNGLLMVDQKGMVNMVNSQMEQMFGYTRQELVGQAMECLLPQRYRSRHPQQRASFFSAPSVRGMGTDRTLTACRKDGSEFPVEIGLSPVDTEDGPMVLASIMDISARHEAELALHASNERLTQHALALERSNKELDTFAYVASHDLKSPLRGIDQLATWISEDLGESLSQDTQNYVRLMRVRVNRMESLLSDLLAYSRVGRQEYQLAEVDTAALAHDIFDMLSNPEAISLTVVEPMPVFVTLRVPLELVLRNLINNAIKHHDKPQGTIVVSAETTPEGYEFMVADNGPGVPVEHQERVFGIFQTLRPRDDVEGSGMGLAIVKKTIENYGGTISLSSDGSNGSRFQFTWPNEAKMRKGINDHDGAS